ncbi:hypothetical protein E6P78_31590 [Streptomyces sp. A0958]|nr:hypothetical protein E6P78_31590 [Streptomyces sp. A0958]
MLVEPPDDGGVEGGGGRLCRSRGSHRTVDPDTEGRRGVTGTGVSWSERAHGVITPPVCPQLHGVRVPASGPTPREPLRQLAPWAGIPRTDGTDRV